MQKILRKAGIVSAFALTAVLSSAASATPFSITGVAFTDFGNGYGAGNVKGNGNDDETLLNVDFLPLSPFSTKNFDLTKVNDTSGLFKFGTVAFNEKDISQAEATNANLGVSATFTFDNPGIGAQSVKATGTAVFGVVNDPGDSGMVDFTINWNPLTVDFGTNGSFQIEVTQLAFSTNNQALDATAKITLLKADTAVTPPGGNVPEPGSLALAGLGLAAAGLVRRRKR